MPVITMQADSTTLILNGTAIADFLEGDTLELAPVNPATEHVNGSDGSVAIQGRLDGGVHNLTVRVMKYSDADIFLNNALNQAAPVVFDGSAKENYVKDGTASVSSWLLESGSITDRPTDIKNNQEGNILMQYVIKFRNASRNI